MFGDDEARRCLFLSAGGRLLRLLRLLWARGLGLMWGLTGVLRRVSSRFRLDFTKSGGILFLAFLP
ncbi:MAG: hypothetical protein GVY30_00990, partial [Chloroflexi bacterium]|nr:hypothetical protein [Chloroflexota bacterium]